MTEPANKIVPFGKYKGQPIEALAQDREYAEWLMAQPWFRDKFQPIYNVIVNNFGEPSETPEHNAMQALFLEDSYVLALAMATDWYLYICREADAKVRRLFGRLPECFRYKTSEVDYSAKEIERLTDSTDRWEIQRRESEAHTHTRAKKHLEILKTFHGDLELAWIDAPKFRVEKVEAQFEVRGIDVDATIVVGPDLPFRNEGGADVIEALKNSQLVDDNLRFAGWGALSNHARICCELKPTLGDEYPAVLRQMDRNETTVLVVGSFVAEGATLEQCTKLFSRAKKRVLMLAEVRGLVEHAKRVLENGETLSREPKK